MTLRRVSIPTPNYSSRGGTPVRLVVLHTAQGSSNYRDLGAYFANGTDQASSHVGIDDTPGEIGEYVRRPDKSWTQAAANPYSVSAELCGWAEWTAAQWHNEHAVMLENTAAWIAEECAAFGIPLRALTAGEAQGGKAGVCDHAALGANGGGHWDIGSGISVAELVAMAAGGAGGTDEKETRAQHDCRNVNRRRLLDDDDRRRYRRIRRRTVRRGRVRAGRHTGRARNCRYRWQGDRRLLAARVRRQYLRVRLGAIPGPTRQGLGARVAGDDPPAMPAWWYRFRRVTIFGLGCLVVVEGLVSPQDRIVELIAGLVMVGVLPLDDLLRAFGRRMNGGSRPSE